MDFERTLFRLYDRVMSSEKFHLAAKIMIITYFTLSAISLIALLYFHFSYMYHTEILSKAISSQILGNATHYKSQYLNLTLGMEAKNESPPNITLLPEDIYNISIGSVKYQFSIYYQIATMPKEVRKRVNFTEHVIKLEYSDICPTYIWPFVILFNELDTIIINQIAGIFESNSGFIKNENSREIWLWSDKYFKEMSYPTIGTKIYNILISFIIFVILSVISGLICRIAIAGSAGVMISLSWCLTLFNATENTRMILFLSYPWAGQPAFALRNAHKSIGPLVLSYFLTLFVFYFMYTCTSVLWTSMVFGRIFPNGIDERVFSVFSLIEFFNLLFTRTKKSVLWMPRVIAIFMCSFFLYRRNNFYPFLSTYFFVVTMASFGVMILMLVFIEKPIFVNEGPSFESPRLVYQPVFNRNQSALPEIWTMFYPVVGRGFFTEQQMNHIFPRQGPL